MKILLTGHRGFIGSHLYKALAREHDVLGLDKTEGVNLCNSSETDALPDFDIVIHLAAKNGTKYFYETPFEVALDNSLPTINLLNRFKGNPTKFVFASTCEIFNGAIDQFNYRVPTDENVPVVFNDILNPRWSYSIPKALGENLVANSGMNWMILRFFNIYGPGQEDHFIPEFVKRAKKGIFKIEGNDTRSFCFIDDAINIMLRLIQNFEQGIFHVGKQEEVSIEQVARLILKLMGHSPHSLKLEPGKPGSASRRCPDTSRMMAKTKFNQYTPLEVGLKKTIESIL